MKSERDPIDVTPADVLGDDTCEEASSKHAEQHARNDDGQGSGSAMDWSHVTDERKHELWGNGGGAGNEGEDTEQDVGAGQTQANPGAGLARKRVSRWGGNIPYGGSEPDQPQSISSPLHQVSQGTQE